MSIKNISIFAFGIFVLGICYFLINHRGSVKLSDYYKETEYRLLLKYIKNGELTEINRLINKGVDVDKVGKRMIPLIFAVKCNNVDSFEHLLKKGANANAILDKDLSVITESIKSGNPEFLKICVKFGGDVDLLHPVGGRPIFYAVDQNNDIAVDFLLEKGANINLANEYNVTAFTNLLGRNDFTGCLYILNKGQSPIKSNKDVLETIKYNIETAYKVRDMRQPVYKDFFKLIEKLESLGIKFDLKEI